MIFFLFCISIQAEGDYANLLVKENSPYLQQHAHNPVEWYPWGREALQKAKNENKPIFLSIGYSTCHWCHVMEEESFSDRDVAKILNSYFVSIKVDKEQYPQIDKKYQRLFRRVHGKRGGWPLNLFMSPEGEVFFMGTYIPKEEGYGSKGLMHLLPYFVTLYNDKKAFLQKISYYKKVQSLRLLDTKPGINFIDRVVQEIAKQFDTINGGFATHPKFPEASKFELLLDIYALSKNKQALMMAELTLIKMARGGIYDQVGGGFFRYTTDEAWQIPHFEKMLYTNAELIAVYAKAYLMTGKELYKKVVDESISQMEKHYMQKGVYLSASDADSEGEEGGYFIYEYTELKSLLQKKGWKLKEIEDALGYLGIEEDGNIDGDFSLPHITSEFVPSRVEALKAYLKEIRAKRIFPFVDKKINTAWNAMMIKALFEASKSEPKYMRLAQKRLSALLMHMRVKEILYHQTLLGKAPTQKALLEDYAFLIDALIAGYERTYQSEYLTLAQRLSNEALERFYRDKQWYLSDDGTEVYADFDDRHYSVALSVILEDLVQIGALTEALRYISVAKASIRNSGAVLKGNPASAAKLVHTFLRLEKADVVIHARKKRLQSVQKEIDAVAYPFVLSKVQESDAYLACSTTMCFASDKNITKLIEKIKKVVQ